MCVPLLARRGATGALELTDPGPDEPEPELVAALAALGLLIGRAVERSATETQLRRSDALLRATLNAAFDAVVAMDADGAIIAVNPAAETMFGYPAERAGRPRAGRRAHPAELREPHRRGLANYIAHGEERVLGHPLELTALRADGSEFPVEVAVRRLDVRRPAGVHGLHPRPHRVAAPPRPELRAVRRRAGRAAPGGDARRAGRRAAPRCSPR